MEQEMKILVTGAKGFIGKNLIVELKNQGFTDIFEYDIDTDPALLNTFTQEAEFVYHLAGVNRPLDQAEFMAGNFGFTSTLLESLIKNGNKCPIMLSSSIQAELKNPYGESKKAGEQLLLSYGKEHGVEVLVYRFTNVFGKWCRPNYNSVVATFCHNVANDLPIQVNDPSVVLNLVYIDDLVSELISALKGNEHKENDYCYVAVTQSISLGRLAELIQSFKINRTDKFVPDFIDPLIKKLYSTYLSYLPTNKFSYELKMNIDQRGSFTEFLKTTDRGQVSINVAKPGIVKGNHWHHTKNEKFLVVSGKGLIRFRRIDSIEVIEYTVSGEKLEVVDIPVGYTHNIENVGDSDLVTVMWANELLDPNRPDTYFLEV